MCFWKELWRYREMVANLVNRDLKSRYKGSVLGFLWMLVNPLLQMGIYTLVFSVIIKMDIERFYLYLFVALVPWIFFSTCLSVGANVVISQQDMIKKIYFPREILPLSFTLSQFVNMLLSFLIIFVVAAFGGTFIRPMAVLMLPVVAIIQFLLALGMVLAVSALAVFFRDLEHILSIVSMVWMYLTPVIYPIEYVPNEIKNLLYLNPMTFITISYRDILYYGRMPKPGNLLYAFLSCMIILVTGEGIFSHLKRRFAEEL